MVKIYQCYFHELCMKGVLLADLKGNNSCKTYNFRIKVGTVQWSILWNICLKMKLILFYYAIKQYSWTNISTASLQDMHIEQWPQDRYTNLFLN